MYIKSNDFQVTVASLLFQPEYHLFDFSPNVARFKFLVITEENLRLAPFIDIRFEPMAQASFSVNSRKLFSLESQHDQVRPPTHFIFHHAFVCSTLLARCLDQIDAFFSLKEPWILRRLSDYKRSQKKALPEAQWQEMFTCSLALLSKNYCSGRSSVIKATNVANNLISDVLRWMPQSKLVYLYSELGDFLVSNLKKPADTQQKMTWLLSEFMRGSDLDVRFKQFVDSGRLSLLHVCALIWVNNIYSLKQAIESYEGDALIKLHMDDLLGEPSVALERVSRHFGHVPSVEEIDAMSRPEVMGTNAKNQTQRYSREMKQQESRLVLQTYGTQIQDTLNWIEPLVRELELREFLGSRDIAV
jgi:hypothetical protein